MMGMVGCAPGIVGDEEPLEKCEKKRAQEIIYNTYGMEQEADCVVDHVVLEHRSVASIMP